MRIVYLLLSPTFGMHQYTADLANRMAAAGHAVSVITTAHAPQQAYSPQVRLVTPLAARTTGFSRDGLHLAAWRRVRQALAALNPDGVHFTGVHLWNPTLLRSLRRAGVPTVHTLHDLDPHLGVRFGRLIRLWNRSVVAWADHILVHGQCYRQRLLGQGLAPERVVYTPLLHLFLSYQEFAALDHFDLRADLQADPYVLFFGRLEKYKGVQHLLAAAADAAASRHPLHMILAGPGEAIDPLPAGVEVRNWLIDSQKGVDLFRRCSVVVLPYLDATQSAVIASAYYFAKPVVVSDVGALAEYVQAGQTGWIVPPGDVQELSRVLILALSDPAGTARMGAAGQAWYEKQRRMEWHTLESLYHSMSARKRKR